MGMVKPDAGGAGGIIQRLMSLLRKTKGESEGQQRIAKLIERGSFIRCK